MVPTTNWGRSGTYDLVSALFFRSVKSFVCAFQSILYAIVIIVAL